MNVFTTSSILVVMGALTGGAAADIPSPLLNFELTLDELPRTCNLDSDRDATRENSLLRVVAKQQEAGASLGMLREPSPAFNLQDASAAAPSTDDAGELAKKLSNPIASLISVPFQLNYDEGFGPNDASRTTLNIQPVVPLSLNEDWNLIIRTILPVICAESPAAGISSEFGLGDITQSFFFSPVEGAGGGDVIWGVGPVFLYPTGTASVLGTEKWAAGPTVVALKQHEGWTYGALFNHLWSFAGDSDRAHVNATFLQPFVAYQFPTATTLTANLEMSYDWNAEEATIPLNLLVSQVFKIGDQPVSLQAGPRIYLDSPPGGPEWGFRINFTLLFPR